MKLDIRIGKVLACEPVPKSDKLLKLLVNVGEKEPRTIVSGIKEWYSPDNLINEYITVLLNLEPRKIFGIKSHGMLLAADQDNRAFLLKPALKNDEKLTIGTRIE